MMYNYINYNNIYQVDIAIPHDPLHKVFRQRMWMRHWGAESPKPTNLWSNSLWVQQLSLGTLTKDRPAFELEMLGGRVHLIF